MTAPPRVHADRRRWTAVLLLVAACGGTGLVLAAMAWESGVAGQERVIDRRRGILQRSTDDCGIAALENVYAAHGLETARARLRVRLRPSNGGLSMLALRDRARADGLPAIGVRAPLTSLKRIPLPAIVPVDHRHYLVVEGFGKDDSVVAIDPAKGVVRMSVRRFAARWRGMALCFGSARECTGGDDAVAAR